MKVCSFPADKSSQRNETLKGRKEQGLPENRLFLKESRCRML